MWAGYISEIAGTKKGQRNALKYGGDHTQPLGVSSDLIHNIHEGGGIAELALGTEIVAHLAQFVPETRTLGLHLEFVQRDIGAESFSWVLNRQNSSDVVRPMEIGVDFGEYLPRFWISQALQDVGDFVVAHFSGEETETKTNPMTFLVDCLPIPQGVPVCQPVICELETGVRRLIGTLADHFHDFRNAEELRECQTCKALGWL